MVANELMNDLPILQIHTTDRMTFKTCRQLWDFSSPLRQGLEPIRAYEPFWFGTAIHEGIRAHYSRIQTLHGGGETRVLYDSPSETFLQHVHDWWAEIENPSIEDDERKVELTELGPAMLNSYIRFATTEDDFEVVWLERDFNVPIPGIETVVGQDGNLHRVLYSFRTDGLVKDAKGKLWILEHKTCSSFPSSTDYLLNDDQVGSYIWALQEVLDIEIEGVIYNWIKKSIPKQLHRNKDGTYSVDKRQDTTLEIALECLSEDYDLNDLPAKYQDFIDHLKSKGNNFVKRERVRRNRREIAAIGHHLRYEAKDMLDNPHIYRTPNAFNCNRCHFFAPCLSRWEKGDYKTILEQMYKTREPYGG